MWANVTLKLRIQFNICKPEDGHAMFRPLVVYILCIMHVYVGEHATLKLRIQFNICKPEDAHAMFRPPHCLLYTSEVVIV